MWRLITLAPDDWPALAGFIHVHNRRPDGRVRCLHAECGGSVQQQHDELRALAADAACFVAARDEAGQLVGIAGAEVDRVTRRAWVRGPLTGADVDAAGTAPALRHELLQRLHAALPGMRRFDAFPQVDEAALRDSLRRAGYTDQLQHHVMERSAGLPAPTWPAEVRDATPDEAAALASLHGALFPAAYLDMTEMAATADTGRRLLVVPGHDAAGPSGYLYVHEQVHDHDACIDFLGVAPSARGRGHGQALLAAALHWALVQRGLPRVSLTVRQDRAPALGLYASAGFREVAAGAQMTFDRDGAGAAA